MSANPIERATAARHPPAVAHHRLEQRLATGLLTSQPEDVVRRAAVELPKYLLRVRERGLLCGQLHSSAAVVGHELVDHVQARRVLGHRKCRADAEAVDGRAVGDEAGDLMLIEIAAGDNLDVGQSGCIQLPAGPTRVRGQIAGVQPDGGRRSATGLAHKLDDRGHTRLDVVGVDQQRRRGKRRHEAPERLALADVGLDEAVRHGAGHGDAEGLAGGHVRCRLHAGDVGRPGCGQRGVGAVRVPQAEIDDGPPIRRRHDARGL